MRHQRQRRAARAAVIPIGILAMCATACAEGTVTDEEYSELEDRVEFVERELGTVSDRVGVLEERDGSGRAG